MNPTSGSEPWQALQDRLRATPEVWLVTGAAGFIGSHLVESLLRLDQAVVGLDNFSTGFERNLDEVGRHVTPAQWARFHLVTGDLREPADCLRAMLHRQAGSAGRPVTRVLHQAALGSVPRSLADPLATHASNVTGFLNLLVAARDAGVRRVVYASSSSVYGDHPALPKVEAVTGQVLSPYAAGKLADEIYAGVFARCYGLPLIGLRYFNVFGARQDPDGAYAAVIPRWVAALLRAETVWINGDGETSRDFCHVANAVQANLLAACAAEDPALAGAVFNVAVGERTTLNALFASLRERLAAHGVDPAVQPGFRAFRAGDVRHSLADISRARRLLGYAPTHTLSSGLAESLDWYVRHAGARLA